jgi:hypothetical protein
MVTHWCSLDNCEKLWVRKEFGRAKNLEAEVAVQPLIRVNSMSEQRIDCLTTQLHLYAPEVLYYFIILMHLGSLFPPELFSSPTDIHKQE